MVVHLKKYKFIFYFSLFGYPFGLSVYTLKTRVQNSMKSSYHTKTKNHKNRKIGSVRFIFGMVFWFGFKMHRVTFMNGTIFF